MKCLIIDAVHAAIAEELGKFMEELRFLYPIQIAVAITKTPDFHTEIR